ncbi:MAG: type II glyceraldehyde-3-phosphate dehydrogenase [Anaerolineales bacterium]|nr:type II glyceraldehyde-3-phosphate dehydrogenase [Anaerolineales bacterium]
MAANKVSVGVKGYSVIGKTIADAALLQSDMELIGVSDLATDYRRKVAAVLGLPIFSSLPEKVGEMKTAGIPIEGTIDDLLAAIDVVVDCTPKGIGAKNLECYGNAGGKAVFQGGEKHELTNHSFVVQANYETALGLDATRVVSCNTTSTVRTLNALQKAGLLKGASGVLVRRATDPWESDHSGIMNTVVPEPKMPSHQGLDAKTVVPDLDVITIAAKAAHTQNHSHYWIVKLTRAVNREEVLSVFRSTLRIAFVRMADGIVALNRTIEVMKDLGRPRGDMWEVALWEDVLTVNGQELYYTYQVHNEAIVVPERIDAIRALTGTIESGAESLRITDDSLRMKWDFLTR